MGERASFGERLSAAVSEYGPLCAGIDPHSALLASWGLPDTVAGLERFTMTCVEAFAGSVACVKPQSAFYERFGAAGIGVLERAVAALSGSPTQVLLDVKRGDIGSTMEAYAQAYLSDDGPLAVDAITVSPYLGYGSLRPALDLAAQTGRGVFVLVLTSNPEGREVQHAATPTGTVAADMVRAITSDNAPAARRGALGSVGMVVGATTGDAVRDLGLDLSGANAPLLAPGLGAQGAGEEDLRRVFGAALPSVLAASSREVLSAGPDVGSLREKAATTNAALIRILGRS